jgi:hypothetical protein
MKWFKHDTDASIDAKLQELLLDYGAAGYGLYWYCIELIAQGVGENNITFELEHDARIIARNLNLTIQETKDMMKKMVELDLFCINKNDKLACYALAKRLDKSMTSNQNFRDIISQIKDNHDEYSNSHDKVMINHDLVMQEEKREEEKREEEKREEEKREEEKREEEKRYNLMQKKQFTFTLPNQRLLASTSKEYQENLAEYIQSINGSITYEDFYNQCEMKPYKYKNFKLAYDKWISNNRQKQPQMSFKLQDELRDKQQAEFTDRLLASGFNPFKQEDWDRLSEAEARLMQQKLGSKETIDVQLAR